MCGVGWEGVFDRNSKMNVIGEYEVVRGTRSSVDLWGLREKSR
jgi:hypothetical protein